MTSLQDFISRRNNVRGSHPSSRPQSPEKPEQRPTFASLSQIPVARVASRNSNANVIQQTKLEDDDSYEDDFKDSEILSLENQDDQQNYVNKQLFQSQQRATLTTEYHQDVYHWQSGVNNHGNTNLESEEDDLTEGRSTPRPQSEDGDFESRDNKMNHQQDEFYTSLDIRAPRNNQESTNKPQNTHMDRASSNMNGLRDEKLEQNKEHKPTEAAFNSSLDDQSAPFNFEGALQILAKMGLPLRGTEKIVFHDELGHNLTYELQDPPHPYLICVSQSPTMPNEILRMRSEIATMAYIRQYHPSIPIPEVVYYDLDQDNAAQIPFMVIRTLKGEHFHDVFANDEALQDKKKILVILEKLAKIHTEMMKPSRGITLEQMGDIFQRKDKSNRQTFTVGPFIETIDDNEVHPDKDPTTLPSTSSLPDLCTQLYQSCESKSLSSRPNRQVRSTKRRLAGLLGLLQPPSSHLTKLSLFHTSLNFSSILVNPSTLDITCVFNWRDAHVLPFLMTAVYPAELRSPQSEWNLWVDENDENDGNDTDWLWGLRGVYEARLAKFDARYAGDVWEDEEVEKWLKIWEVVSGGVEKWTEKSRWIEGQLADITTTQ